VTMIAQGTVHIHRGNFHIDRYSSDIRRFELGWIAECRWGGCEWWKVVDSEEGAGVVGDAHMRSVHGRL
jgi:hypothetical protein